MDKDQLSEFEYFVSYFPEIELPVSLSSQYFEVFSNYNKVLPEFLIRKYIIGEDIAFPDRIVSTMHKHKKHTDNIEDISSKEFGIDDIIDDTEFIACFCLPRFRDFHALVYLEVSLMNYDYYLHTFDSAGRTLSKTAISGLRAQGEEITEKVALIDDGLKIWIREGIRDARGQIESSGKDLPGFFIKENGVISKQ